jgi:hypothetical protein
MTEDTPSVGRQRQSVRLNRRSLIKAGAGAAAAGSMGLFGPSPLPLISPRSAAAQGDALTFWQFYAPGGQDPDYLVR